MPRNMLAFVTAVACGLVGTSVAITAMLGAVHIHATPPVIEGEAAAGQWGRELPRPAEAGETARVVAASPEAARLLLRPPAEAEAEARARPALPYLPAATIELTSAAADPSPGAAMGGTGATTAEVGPAVTPRPARPPREATAPRRDPARGAQGELQSLGRSAP